jgi:histidinol-phosphate aminotransferase
VTARTRVVFVANPANPTGACLSASEVARLQKGLPRRTLLILDAAYAEFVDRDDFQAGEDLVESSDNVVILRTFSKAYALAGLRVGWAYCTPSVADVLNRVRGPYNVSLPAQAAAIAALGDTARLAEARRHNIVWRGWLTQGLRGLGLRVLPSETNFLAVHLGSEVRANEGFEFLRSNGILARRLDSYGMDEWLRTSVGLECEVRRVQAAFQAFCGGALAPRRLSDRP